MVFDRFEIIYYKPLKRFSVLGSRFWVLIFSYQIKNEPVNESTNQPNRRFTMQEIRFHGRGGQGTVVASILLAKAFFQRRISCSDLPRIRSGKTGGTGGGLPEA